MLYACTLHYILSIAQTGLYTPDLAELCIDDVVALQANTVKQEGLDGAAQGAQSSQDVPQPVFVAAEAMT